MSSRPAGRWLIIGHYGGHNTGDEAMLAGLIRGAGRDFPGRLVVASRAPVPVTADGAPIDVVPATPYHVLTTLAGSRGVVLGGGTHFQDAYQGARYLRHLRYLARFILVFLVARLLGKRVVLLSMGFGPFLRRPTIWVTKLALRLSHAVTVRDQRSFDEVRPWLPAPKLSLAFDLAALAMAKTSAVPERVERPVTILGLSITSLAYSRARGPWADQDFEERLTAALVTMLRRQHDLSVRIFVIRGGAREADAAQSQRVFEALTQVDPARVRLVPYDADPFATFSRIAECQAFVAMRFHAAVLAYLGRCRLLLLAYHRKVRDLAREVDLPAPACIDLDQQAAVDALERRLCELVGGAVDYKPRLPVAEAVRRAVVNIEVLRVTDSQ